jgi:NADH:ubiquinone oxidoreductase subunit 3 (subunit A)
MKQKYIRKSISTYVYIVVVLLVKKVVIAIIIGPWDVDVQKICFVAYLERISFELFSSFSNLAYEPNYHL